MQLNPARGRKLCLSTRLPPPLPYPRFMQLNPARGRKQELQTRVECGTYVIKVYAAQPREGTETLTITADDGNLMGREVYAAQPREGTETVTDTTRPCDACRFMQLNPARGRKLSSTYQLTRDNDRFMQLNPARGRKPLNFSFRQWRIDCVYAAQPREGTETMDNRPKDTHAVKTSLCSSTPRGDGNTL